MKKDNSTFWLKKKLRDNLLAELSAPVIMETHGGKGELYLASYKNIQTGIVFEKNPDKADILGHQRPTWRVYECDCLMALDAGIGLDLNINFFDLDPYGQPWPTVEKIFKKYLKASKVCIAVNDGLRQKLKMKGGWTVKSMSPMVQKYGNQTLCENYKEICLEMFEQYATAAGYSITKWAAYYCGHADQMTHYGAVLERYIK